MHCHFCHMVVCTGELAEPALVPGGRNWVGVAGTLRFTWDGRVLRLSFGLATMSRAHVINLAFT